MGAIIEKKSPWRNQRCMSCWKTLFKEKTIYVVRLDYSKVNEQFRVCEDCLKEIFNKNVIEKAKEEDN